MMKNMLIILISCVLLSACGTVVRGTTEEVRIIVEPQDAVVTTSLGHHCTSMPCSVKVSRREKFSVSASKQGYVTQSVNVTTKVSKAGAAGFAGNVVAGGVVGMGVDVATGAALDHTPNPVVIKLVPEGSAPEDQPSAPTVQPATSPAKTPVS